MINESENSNGFPSSAGIELLADPATQEVIVSADVDSGGFILDRAL